MLRKYIVIKRWVQFICIIVWNYLCDMSFITKHVTNLSGGYSISICYFYVVVKSHFMYVFAFPSYLEIEIFVSPGKEFASWYIWCLMANGRGVIQQVGWAITPFFDNWLLDSSGVVLGVHTDLFRDFDAVWLRYESENENKIYTSLVQGLCYYTCITC